MLVLQWKLIKIIDRCLMSYVQNVQLFRIENTLGTNTNPDDKLEFVLFFSNEYFGIKVDVVSMMAVVGAATFLIIKKKREG